MIFRQLFDTTSSTYTYLLAEKSHRQALLIDPVFGQVGRDVALIEELGLKLMLAIDTAYSCGSCYWRLAAQAEDRLPDRIGENDRGRACRFTPCG